MQIQDVRRAISEYAAATGADLDIPPAVVKAVLDDMGDRATIAEVAARYIGPYDNLRGVAHALALQSYPPTDGPHGVINGIDFSVWPFSHIDWEAATVDLGQSLTLGTLLVVDGRYYFDVS